MPFSSEISADPSCDGDSSDDMGVASLDRRADEGLSSTCTSRHRSRATGQLSSDAISAAVKPARLISVPSMTLVNSFALPALSSMTFVSIVPVATKR